MQTPSTRLELRTVESAQPPSRAPFGQDGSSVTIGDVYFTIFRHKKMILLCTLLGLAAAFTFYRIDKRVYQSEAKLFIRYVVDSRTPGRSDVDGSVKSPDPGGATILNSELEIITSFDLAGTVVDTIGINKFIEPRHDDKDRDRAIYEFSQNLKAQVPARSSVLLLSYTSTNPNVVQPVLREVINCYLKKHVEIHRASGLVDDYLTQETEQLRSRLTQTEEDLRKAKSKVGYASIEDGKKTVIDLSSRLRQEIFTAETELAERSAFIRSIQVSNQSVTPEEPARTTVPTDTVINTYSRTIARIDFLRKAEQELLGQFTPENNRVKETRAQLAEAEATKKKLEEDNPSLTVLHATQSAFPGMQPSSTDLVVEGARVKALQSKISALNEQLRKLRAEASEIDDMEAEIVDLNRKKELDEANYRKYAASLEQARLDEAMSSGHVSNISEIQSPSLPLKAKTKRIQIILLLAASGLGLGLLWAFAIEMFFDKTIKRPSEIERRLNLPLLLSIPVVDRAFKKRLQKMLSIEQPPKKPAVPEGNSLLKNKDLLVGHALQPFHATLRDRLIGYFENRNLTHKPKFIAVTGLAKNSGVSSTAAGIAQSLSETGEGNVLLVSMNPGKDAALQFSQGKPVTHLDEILEAKQPAPIQDKLYVVTEGSNSDRLLRNLPQRFSKMLPKLKESDFDYIIFDMPLVSQVSITPRLAGFMDIVLLVLEAEKTDRDLVEKASALLAQSKAQVGVVLNKTRNYIPPGLYQESLGDL